MARRRKRRSHYEDITTGKLANRRYGLRIDDDVEIYIVGGDMLRVVRGRLLDFKRDLQLIDTNGYYHRISYDWVTDIVILKHNRPLPEYDEEYRETTTQRRVAHKQEVTTAEEEEEETTTTTGAKKPSDEPLPPHREPPEHVYI